MNSEEKQLAKPFDKNLLPRWKSHKIVNAAQVKRILIKMTCGSSKGEMYYPGDSPGVSIDTIRVRIVNEFKLWHPTHTTAVLEFETASVEVSLSFLMGHEVKMGGYYVIYSNGYVSYSPPEAFEEGYSLHRELNPLHFGRTTVLAFKEITDVIHHHDGSWEITMSDVTEPLLLSEHQVPSAMIIEVGDSVRIDNNEYVGIAKNSNFDFLK